MTKFTLFATAIFLLFLNACQYPVGSSALTDPQKFLVIDAVLTQNYGKVRVSNSLTDVNALGGYFSAPPPPFTTTYILDSHGNRVDFSPDGTADSSFHGVVGETYQLFVQIDGKNYESNPETMRICPEIDSIRPIFSRESFRDPNDVNYDGFDVYSFFQDSPGAENYYQWDWIHYARAIACDRKYNQAEGKDVLYPCDPLDCWTISYNPAVVVQSDKLRDGQPIAQKIVRVPFIRPPYKYYLRLEQRAITPSVFAYLQSIETQTQHVGTLFDVPAQTKFSPNIHNVDDPAEQILGVLNVFSYRYQIIYVDRKQKINGAEARLITDGTPFVADPFAKAPCTENQYRTQKKPEKWED